MAAEAQLDHVVLLLPHADIVDPPKWLTNNFTISPGGRHADDKTENRLVLFQDGTYLELIAFINDDPSKRHGHWWDKPYGIVDYALTSSSPLDFPALQSRLDTIGTGVSYQEPIAGGRTKPDGTQLKWQVTFPTGTDRGTVPFWCHDVTPRELRVPVTEASTTHPSGAVGMAGVREAVMARQAPVLGRVMSGVLAVGQSVPGELLATSFQLGVPKKVPGLKSPELSLHTVPDGSERELFLTLMLQGRDGYVGGDIEKSIGNGVVSIKWVV